LHFVQPANAVQPFDEDHPLDRHVPGTELMNTERTTQEYFARRDTPAAGSPVGVTMLRLLENSPGMGFEEARERAKVLLLECAGKRVYRAPRILSAEEHEIQKARLASTLALKAAA
jgi:hypothetical protein